MATTTQSVRDHGDGEPGIELAVIKDGTTETEQAHRDEAVALHPVDRGFHAWLFVFAATGLEILIWGFPLWLVPVL